jgi:hypothetical protein
MYIGYIVNERHPGLKTITEAEIVNYTNKLPILVVGLERAFELYPHISLKSKVIDKDKEIYYTLSITESPTKYIETVNNFIINCFDTLKRKHKVKHITSLEDIKFTFKKCFLYETNVCVTLTSSTEIYYINKEIISFFSKVNVTGDFLIEKYLKGCEVISWNYPAFFAPYLKINECYKSSEEVKRIFQPYGDIEMYMGSLCLNLLNLLTYNNKELELWQRAYTVEKWLSQIKIKVNINKIKDLASDEDNIIMQNIYYSIEEGYVTQQYNGTDKVTGRMYVSGSTFSLQSLSKVHRDIIVAEPGCVLVEFDYDAFEYKLLSQLCNIDIDIDPHLALSKLLFKDELHRPLCKGINYSLLYGKSLNSIITELLSNPDIKLTAKELKKELTKVLNPILEFTKKLEIEFDKNNVLFNFFGRRIYPEEKYKSLNNYIQSTAADILIIKLEKLNNYLQNYDSINKIVLQNHDSILLNLSLKTIESSEIASDIKNLLEVEEQGLVSKVDVLYGGTWKF